LHINNAIKKQKPPYKRRSRNKKKKTGDGEMIGPPDSTARIYVPPHLRNRSFVDAGKADSAHSSGVAVSASPTASNQSKDTIISKTDPVP
jgi:hypothetical protein